MKSLQKIPLKFIKIIGLVIVSIIFSVVITKIAISSSSFRIPLECNLDKDCYIMHYVDLDPSPKAIDFGCGRQTYDTHSGTDFGIANLQVMEQGIPVKAIATGMVLRIRDGVKDKLVQSQEDKEATNDQECGNGIVIEHENGWESQYCHLKQNSIVVKPGMKVEKGTTLGMVGSSGLASFPHVHLSLRHEGKMVDPFVGFPLTKDEGCNVKRKPLWEKNFAYKPTGLIDTGFASEIPTQEKLWQGQYYHTQITEEAPLLIFWVHAYGVLSGDVESFNLTAPSGKVIVNKENTLQKSSRTWMTYIGKRNNSVLEKGTWIAKYQLKRGNQIIIDLNREVGVAIK